MPQIYSELCQYTNVPFPERCGTQLWQKTRLFWCKKCRNDDSSALCSAKSARPPLIGCRLWPVANWPVEA